MGFHCKCFEENEDNGLILHGLSTWGQYGEKLYDVSFTAVGEHVRIGFIAGYG